MVLGAILCRRGACMWCSMRFFIVVGRAWYMVKSTGFLHTPPPLILLRDQVLWFPAVLEMVFVGCLRRFRFTEWYRVIFLFSQDFVVLLLFSPPICCRLFRGDFFRL